ncbi:O-antigen ligase family protein [Leucobacter luti]|uniref:O-antigen ligase family protein n=1 Tax=Leucobacter luti TaxID=340320 RepID=UPI003D01B9F0
MNRRNDRAIGSRASATVLPSWPLTLMIAGLPLWWFSGLAEIVWIPIAGCMAALMLRRGRISIPRGMGLWLLFLVLMLVSVIGIDSSGRLLAFGYRALLYLSVTVVFVYVLNAPERLPMRTVLGLLTLLWVYTWIGGYAGILFPEFAFATPLAWVLPDALLSNELVGEMAIRRTAQYNPDGHLELAPRPSAPFLYTNSWGSVYSLTLPAAVAYAGELGRGRRFQGLLIAFPVSFVPAAFSLNRGMLLGLGVAGAYLLLRFALAGRAREVRALGGVGIVGFVAVFLLDLPERLSARTEVSASTTTRSNLYLEAWERTLQSPLFGYGAPRPSQVAEPAVGTQGQVWMVMFSHGLPALACFLLALVWLVLATARWRGPHVLVLHTIQLVTLVESFFYGLLPHGLIVSFIAGAAALREGAPPRARDDARTTQSVPMRRRRGVRTVRERGLARSASRPRRVSAPREAGGKGRA